MKRSKSATVAAAKKARGAPGRGRSLYAHKMRMQLHGTYSRTSPFGHPGEHTLVDPPGPRPTWDNQQPLLEGDQLAVLFGRVISKEREPRRAS